MSGKGNGIVLIGLGPEEGALLSMSLGKDALADFASVAAIATGTSVVADGYKIPKLKSDKQLEAYRKAGYETLKNLTKVLIEYHARAQLTMEALKQFKDKPKGETLLKKLNAEAIELEKAIKQVYSNGRIDVFGDSEELAQGLDDYNAGVQRLNQQYKEESEGKEDEDGDVSTVRGGAIGKDGMVVLMMDGKSVNIDSISRIAEAVGPRSQVVADGYKVPSSDYMSGSADAFAVDSISWVLKGCHGPSGRACYSVFLNTYESVEEPTRKNETASLMRILAMTAAEVITAISRQSILAQIYARMCFLANNLEDIEKKSSKGRKTMFEEEGDEYVELHTASLARKEGAGEFQDELNGMLKGIAVQAPRPRGQAALSTSGDEREPQTDAALGRRGRAAFTRASQPRDGATAAADGTSSPVTLPELTELNQSGRAQEFVDGVPENQIDAAIKAVEAKRDSARGAKKLPWVTLRSKLVDRKDALQPPELAATGQTPGAGRATMSGKRFGGGANEDILAGAVAGSVSGGSSSDPIGGDFTKMFPGLGGGELDGGDDDEGGEHHGGAHGDHGDHGGHMSDGSEDDDEAVQGGMAGEDDFFEM